jgi:hypothetical protein
MRSRRIKFQVGLPHPEQDAAMYFPPVRFRGRPGTSPRAHSQAGMGTKNFITEILDTYAGLNKDRKQALIDYSYQLAAEQRAERRAAN